MNLLIKKKYGFIQLSEREDGLWVDQFVIYLNYRGKGYARKLANYIPPNCTLLASPIRGYGEPCLTSTGLIKFYKSIGFKLVPNPDRDPIMTRKISLADLFPNDLWGRKARDRARREHRALASKRAQAI